MTPVLLDNATIFRLRKSAGLLNTPVAIVFGASTSLHFADDIDISEFQFYASTRVYDGVIGIVPAHEAWKHYEILHTGSVEIF